MLAADKQLPQRYFDHPMSGDWSGFRDCHIRPDLVLIYEKPDPHTLRLVPPRLSEHAARAAGRVAVVPPLIRLLLTDASRHLAVTPGPLRSGAFRHLDARHPAGLLPGKIWVGKAIGISSALLAALCILIPL